LYSTTPGDPGRPALVVVSAPGTTVGGIDFTTDQTVEVKNYGPFAQLGDENAAPGSYYAVRVSASHLAHAVAQAAHGAPLLARVFFFTGAEDSSVVPHYAAAMLTTGTLNPDGTAEIDVRHPLVRKNNFVGHNFNFTPWFFSDARTLTKTVRS